MKKLFVVLCILFVAIAMTGFSITTHYYKGNGSTIDYFQKGKIKRNSEEIVENTDSKYVSPNGKNSNAGTLAKPWKTIQYAVDQVKAGETIYVMNGTYRERVILHKSGDSKNPITIKNYSNHKPIIEGKGITWWSDSDGALFEISGKSNWIIEGIHLQNSYAQGFGDDYTDISAGTRSENVTIRNSSITYAGGPGVYFVRSKNIVIDGVTVTKTNKNLMNEAITISNSDRFEIKNSRVIDSYKEGIDIKTGSSNGSIHDNFIDNAKGVGIYIDAYDAYQSNIDVYNNTITTINGAGISTGAERGGTLENVTIRNNIVYDSLRGYNVVTNDSASGMNPELRNITIRNNISFNNKFTGVYVSDLINNVLIENNIFYQSSGAEVYNIQLYDAEVTGSSKVTIRNNLYGEMADSPELPAGKNYVLEPNYNKVMVDPTGSLTGKRDFRLTKTLRAKIAGYKGVDIGVSAE